MTSISEQAMASAALKQMNVWENNYYDITELFLLSDEQIATVPAAQNPEAQLALIEPLIEVIGESADVITEEYIGLCEGATTRKSAAKGKIEGALRRIYMALNDFSAKTKDTKNAAQQVVTKIKRQLETIISHVVEFVTVSLDRIMQKNDVEELKQRHANIALMLHQMSQGA